MNAPKPKANVVEDLPVIDSVFLTVEETALLGSELLHILDKGCIRHTKPHRNANGDLILRVAKKDWDKCGKLLDERGLR